MDKREFAIFASGLKTYYPREGLLPNDMAMELWFERLKDIPFNSLSTSATFVAGRISNGMITWKTEDGRYVRYTLKGE